MVYTAKFKKMKRAMLREYGKAKGTSVAFATAKKRHMRIYLKKE